MTVNISRTRKRIEIDGKFFRQRRGKLVEIPAEWVDNITTPATIRQRPSKMIRKLAKKLKYEVLNHNYKERKNAVDVIDY